MMQMKVLTLCFICGMFILFTSPLLAFYPTSQDTAKTDTVKLDYENVTVSVTTDWGTSDKHDKANVQLIWSGKKVIEVVVFKPHSECRIILIEGIVVTISDSNTGKVLKRFK